jgi:hypothetical protein
MLNRIVVPVTAPLLGGTGLIAIGATVLAGTTSNLD